MNINVRILSENKNFDLICDKNETIFSLKSKIVSELNESVTENDLTLRYGFPPKIIEGPEHDEKLLSEMKITNNEVIRIEVSKNSIYADIKETHHNEKTEKSVIEPIDLSKYSVVRKVIPADNSCLFNAINYAMNKNINEPEIMRELISIEIQANPDVYTSVVLEKNPNDYCEWIMLPTTWGGGIELSILSKCFQIRIGVVDIINLTIEYFGEVINNFNSIGLL